MHDHNETYIRVGLMQDWAGQGASTIRIKAAAQWI